MTTLEYKGYIGSVTFDAEAEILHGSVVNTRDVITFQGKGVDEIKQAFAESVEDYLEFCAELGEAPEKPMSGKFNVRISPQLHAYAVAAAASRGISLNTLVEQAIQEKVNHSEAQASAKVAPSPVEEDTDCLEVSSLTYSAQLSRRPRNIPFTPMLETSALSPVKEG